MVTIRTHVDRMYDEFNEVTDYLETQHQISMRLISDESFRKGLLVASASYFERRVKEILLDYVHMETGGNDRLVEFVRANVTDRGYHGLFDWRAPNANQFWRLFGDSFRSAIRDRVRNDSDLDESIKAFLELGNDRNRLVHDDFGAFSLEKTSKEIYDTYRKGLVFIENLASLLRSEI